MPTIQDFTLEANEDGTLIVGTNPPFAIGGMSFTFSQMSRFNGVPVITKSMASGFYGVSGMNIVNSGAGQMSVSLWQPESSGMDLIRGAWAYKIQRVNSGSMTSVTEGYRQMTP